MTDKYVLQMHIEKHSGSGRDFNAEVIGDEPLALIEYPDLEWAEAEMAKFVAVADEAGCNTWLGELSSEARVEAQIHEIMQQPYTREFIKEDVGYSAKIAEFPGCVAQGDTLEEANDNLEQTARSWLDYAIAQHHDIPLPKVLVDSPH